MTFDEFLASMYAKYILIGIGVITLLCAVYDFSQPDGGSAVSSLSSLGLLITVFSILLFLWHHDDHFKSSVVSSLSDSSS